jgi:hypothetical protein
VKNEHLRTLERAVQADPSDLVAVRELADERRRRGDEFLPDVVRRRPPMFTAMFTLLMRVEAVRNAYSNAFLRQNGLPPYPVAWVNPHPRPWIDPLEEARAAAVVVYLQPPPTVEEVARRHGIDLDEALRDFGSP